MTQTETITRPVAANWGAFYDPDTHEGMYAYQNSGMELLTPEDAQDLPPDKLLALAQECGSLLIRSYGKKANGEPRYPLDTKDAERLASQISSREVNVFALLAGATKELKSMAAIVHQTNPFGGPSFAELGRAAEARGSNVSSRALLKARVPWAMERYGDTLDFLVSTTRSAAQWKDVASGRGIQSVWWGSRLHGSQIPFVTTYTNYEYALGEPQPFTGLAIPINPEKWTAYARSRPTYVDRKQSAEMIQALIAEGTMGALEPNIRILNASASTEPTEEKYTILQEPSAAAAGVYAITNKSADNLQTTTYENMQQNLGNTISQRVVIEADVSSSEEGGRVLKGLLQDGWTLAGWQPSQITYGAICPVVARLNPHAAEEAVPWEYHRRYFDEAGMPQTRVYLEQALSEMTEQAKLANH